MTKIPLNVLYYEDSNVSKAYLEYMHRNGYEVAEILVLRFITKKTRILAKFFGKKIAYVIFSMLKKIRDCKSKSLDNVYLHNELQKFNDLIDFKAKFSLKKYSKKIKYLYLENFDDPQLSQYVRQNTSNFYLYTAGGIVPKSFLSIDNLKILHIHPGVVPNVKGSDGLFWSILLRNKPGASCFYMNAGIDTGDIIYTKDFKLPKFNLSSISDQNQIYNALLNYYDPHLRAAVLIDVLKRTNNLNSIKATKQSPSDGRTYFAMHKALIKKVLYKISC